MKQSKLKLRDKNREIEAEGTPAIAAAFVWGLVVLLSPAIAFAFVKAILVLAAL